jgi:DNA-binding beta-propeller fold protein YncE
MKINFVTRNVKRIKIIFILCLFSLSFGCNTHALLTIPSVTINQKSGQSDPTLTQPVVFRVVFSVPINVSSFTISDVNTSGSTAIGTAVDSIIEVAPFNGTTFDVFISVFGSGVIMASIPTAEFTYTSAILGTTGLNPYDVVVDSLGNLYAVNFNSNNVTKITPGGVSSVFGTTGTFPSDITIDSDGNIYTVNYGSDDVTKITPGGVSTILGITGSNPSAITIDSSGNIYTANSNSDDVTKITPGGVSTILGTTGLVPQAITIDSTGNIYTANSDSNNVSKITSDGVSTILGTTGLVPQAITIDNNRNIYTANTDSNNVSKITPSGVSTIFGTTGSNPIGITVDHDENIYTANAGDNNVTKITPSGVSTIFGSTGSNPLGITTDGYGNIYIANSISGNVTKFSASMSGSSGVVTPGNIVFTTSTSTDNSMTFTPPSGGVGIISNPPQVPEGGFVVQINNGATQTNIKNVILSFNAGSDVTRMAVSNSFDFSNSNQEVYTPTKTWDVCASNDLLSISDCPSGQKNVYVKFYTASGHSSAIAIGSITLNTEQNQTPQVISSSNTSTEQGGFLEVKNSKNAALYNNIKGKILLKVEDAGKAYYVHPSNKKIYYLGRASDAFAVMREQGIGITTTDLKKIPIGLSATSGVDQDSDGLSNILEDALGTDKTNVDTDGDGYTDKIEIENNYNPLGSGKQQIDLHFAKKLQGYIFLQVEDKGEAWYINPKNNRRYFLGGLSEAFNIMKTMSLGISNQDFDSLF